jgi:hypothetical protein
LGSAILPASSGPYPVVATGTITAIGTTSWTTSANERFNVSTSGIITFAGRSVITATISAKVIVQRAAGTSGLANMNIMQRKGAAVVFTEMPIPGSQNQVQAANASQLTMPSFATTMSPGDQFRVGVSSTENMNILSADYTIKK